MSKKRSVAIVTRWSFSWNFDVQSNGCLVLNFNKTVMHKDLQHNYKIYLRTQRFVTKNYELNIDDNLQVEWTINLRDQVLLVAQLDNQQSWDVTATYSSNVVDVILSPNHFTAQITQVK